MQSTFQKHALRTPHQLLPWGSCQAGATAYGNEGALQSAEFPMQSRQGHCHDLSLFIVQGLVTMPSAVSRSLTRPPQKSQAFPWAHMERLSFSAARSKRMMLMSTACSGGPTTLVSLHHVETMELSSCGQHISSLSDINI